MPRYTAESYAVRRNPTLPPELGWCVKDGDDTVCDVFYGAAMARRIAKLLNQEREA